MSESVVFDYYDFQEYFPEINTTEAQAISAFNWAEGIINNTPDSFVTEECRRKKMIYLLSAHIVTLLNRGAGNVGTVSGAHEGSVGVNYSTSSVDKLGAGWFGQTQYGLLFWQIGAKYRSGFYVP